MTAEDKRNKEEYDKWGESEPEREVVKIPSTVRIVHHHVSFHGPTKYPSKAKDPPNHDDHQEDHEDIIDKVCVDTAMFLERLLG